MDSARLISIEEMPQGCVLTPITDNPMFSIIVSSPSDAVAIIESLQKMLKTQFPELLQSSDELVLDFVI